MGKRTQQIKNQISSYRLAEMLRINDHAHWLVDVCKGHLSELVFSFQKHGRFGGRPKKYAILGFEQVKEFLLSRYKKYAEEIGIIFAEKVIPTLLDKVNAVSVLIRDRSYVEKKIGVKIPPPPSPTPRVVVTAKHKNAVATSSDAQTTNDAVAAYWAKTAPFVTGTTEEEDARAEAEYQAKLAIALEVCKKYDPLIEECCQNDIDWEKEDWADEYKAAYEFSVERDCILAEEEWQRMQEDAEYSMSLEREAIAPTLKTFDVHVVLTQRHEHSQPEYWETVERVQATSIEDLLKPLVQAKCDYHHKFYNLKNYWTQPTIEYHKIVELGKVAIDPSGELKPVKTWLDVNMLGVPKNIKEEIDLINSNELFLSAMLKTERDWEAKIKTPEYKRGLKRYKQDLAEAGYI